MKKKSILLLSIFVFALLFILPAYAAPKLSRKTLSISVGNCYVLRLKGNGTGQAVKWTTTNKKSVKISYSTYNRAVIKAIKAGTANITAKIGKKKLTCKITILKKVTMPKTLTLTVGDKFIFNAGKKAAWKLSKKIAKISISAKGKKATVTAKKSGLTKLTIKTEKKTYTCSIHIIPKTGATAADIKEAKEIREAKKKADKEAKNKTEAETKPITGIQMDNASISLTQGESKQLSVTILPSDAKEDKTVTWSSNNELVATVTKTGKVNAVGAGIARITATVGTRWKAKCIVTVQEAEQVGTIYGFRDDSYSNYSTCKMETNGKMTDNGETVYKTVFLTNGNERWLDAHVTFEMEDVTPVVIRNIMSDMNIASKQPEMKVSSGADEVAFDNRYGFTIVEPFDEAGPGGSSVSPEGAKVIQVTAGPATRVIKVLAKEEGKVLDFIYLTVESYNYSSETYNAYDLALYKAVRQKAETKLWNGSMTKLEKLQAISEYINATCHYPGSAATGKETNPAFWNRFNVDGRFLYYSLDDVIMNRILDFQGFEISCVAADIIEKVAVEDLGLKYLYDSETDTVADGEGVWIGIGSHSSAPYNGAHETLWYKDAAGVTTAIDTQGMDYSSGSSYVTCEAHHCREKLISLK